MTTSAPKVHVAVVDDEAPILRAWRRLLPDSQFELTVFSSPLEATSWLESSSVDVVVADINMPSMNGMDLLTLIKERWPETEVVMTTGLSGVSLVVEAIKKGAYDFLTKPYENPSAILDTLHKAARSRGRRGGRATPVGGSAVVRSPEPLIIGESASIQHALEMVTRAAASTAPVLICGETGTGKELLARTLHNHSPRKAKPFLAVNCAALTENLLEEELFGHVRGAFTGAVASHRGLLEAADGGTVFLDEIGDMSLRCQGMLLRTIQEGEVRPVGSTQVKSVDVRLVAASNEELERKCRAGTFRWDLYFRLNVVRIDVPPLRDRLDDLPALVHHFLRKHQQKLGKALEIPAPVLEQMKSYYWPGNIRELENAISRAVILAPESRDLSPEDLSALLRSEESTSGQDGGFAGNGSNGVGHANGNGASHPNGNGSGSGNGVRREASEPQAALGDGSGRRPFARARAEAAEQFEREYLTGLLEQHQTVSAAARAAGMDRSNFKRLLKRYGILPARTPSSTPSSTPASSAS